MTTATDFVAAPRSGFPALRLLRERLSETTAAWAKRRRIERELNAHSDRELADMGLTRADIPHVASGALRR